MKGVDNITPVNLQWAEKATVQWLTLVGCMWWQAKYDNSMFLGESDGLWLEVRAVTI